MAAAVVTTTVTRSESNQHYQIIGTCAIDASPATYVTGGIAMNLNQASIKASRTPLDVVVTGSSGYIYKYVKGSDNSNGLLKIYQQSAATSALTEIAQSAIPAGVSGDTLTVTADWLGMF